MSKEDYKARVRDFYDTVLCLHDFDKLPDYIAEDFVDHDAPPGTPNGVEGVRQIFTMFTTAFPDLRMQVEEMYSEDDVVITRATIFGTHQGEFMGIPPTGKSVAYPGIDIIRVDGETLVERWGKFDDVGLMQQLGAIPPMGPG